LVTDFVVRVGGGAFGKFNEVSGKLEGDTYFDVEFPANDDSLRRMSFQLKKAVGYCEWKHPYEFLDGA
jgi:hypothetical protein